MFDTRLARRTWTIWTAVFVASWAARCTAATYYVAVDGSDKNAGTAGKPFATIGRAQEAVGVGDTVVIRGGTYAIDKTASVQGIYACGVVLDKSGREGKPIVYRVAEGERAVFDLSKLRPEGLRVSAFRVSGSWIKVEGIEVVGVQVTIKGHTQSICFENSGNHNVFERLSMHDGMGIGFYMTRGADNLVLNCDAYRNYDSVSEGGKGGNVDGFGCHPRKGDTGNVFRGCRAWFNSDDGYDLINAREVVRFENCWAFYNGYSPEFKKLADGNGFKAGGYGATPADELPDPIPRHVVTHCLAVRNKASGFYANHHPGGLEFVNNAARGNGVGFNLLGRLMDNKTDVDGTGHVLRDNVACGAGKALARIDEEKCIMEGNVWDAKDGEFVSVDERELVRPRRKGGGLPDIGFLRPKERVGWRAGAFEPRAGAGTNASSGQ